MALMFASRRVATVRCSTGAMRSTRLGTGSGFGDLLVLGRRRPVGGGSRLGERDVVADAEMDHPRFLRAGGRRLRVGLGPRRAGARWRARPFGAGRIRLRSRPERGDGGEWRRLGRQGPRRRGGRSRRRRSDRAGREELRRRRRRGGRLARAAKLSRSHEVKRALGGGRRRGGRRGQRGGRR